MVTDCHSSWSYLCQTRIPLWPSSLPDVQIKRRLKIINQGHSFIPRSYSLQEAKAVAGSSDYIVCDVTEALFLGRTIEMGCP